jgi:nucleotide-binding universal stress UspA family protein
MHVLIATTGVLGPDPVVDFTRQLLGQHGRVTVVTVIEVPRDFLQTMDGSRPENDDDAAAAYLEERGRRLVDGVARALEGARIPYDVVMLEGTDPAATISRAANDLEADVVVLGATRPIFNKDAWESVSARVMLESGKPVLVLPGMAEKSDDAG